MLNEPGTTIADGSENPAAEETPAGDAGGPLWLAVAALAWLALSLWSALGSIDAAGGDAMATIQVAIGLAALISAALVGGAGVGLAAARWLAPRLHPAPGVRYGVALGGGLLTGIASAATVILAGEAGGSTLMLLGAVIAAGATIGGALAGVRASAIVAAGVAAALGVFLLTFVRGLFTSQLLDLFGAGETTVSLLDAQQRLAWASSAVGGLVAGLIAFGYLRRATRHAAAPPRGLAYLIAGGGVGALQLLTEVIIRIGGAQIIELASSLSESDALFQDLAGTARINSALVVFFVGALTAMVAFGRTLGPTSDDPAED